MVPIIIIFIIKPLLNHIKTLLRQYIYFSQKGSGQDGRKLHDLVIHSIQYKIHNKQQTELTKMSAQGKD